MAEFPQYNSPYQEPQSIQIPQIQEQYEVVQQFQPVPATSIVLVEFQEPQFVEPESEFVPQYVDSETELAFAPAIANPQAQSRMDEFFYKMAELKF